MNFNKKYIQNNTNNKLNTIVKLIYLQIKHPQSIFPRSLALVLNSKTELLDLIPARYLLFIINLFFGEVEMIAMRKKLIKFNFKT